MFWYTRGYFSDGWQWLEDMLAIAVGSPAGDLASLPALAHVRALIGAGVLATNQGAIERASALLGEGLAMSRELNDAAATAISLNYLGLVARDKGDWTQAATLHEEGLVLMRKQGDARGIATSLDNLGRLARDQGDWERAASLHEESLMLMRELGDTCGIATTLDNLGLVAYGQGDHKRAAVLVAESLALRRELGDKMGIAYCLLNLGMTAHGLGDYGQATMLHAEGLLLARLLGETGATAQGLEGLAHVAVTPANPQYAPRRATLLLAASATLRASMGLSLPPVEQARVEHAWNEARTALGADAFAIWAEGQALSVDEAIALAVQAGRSQGE
jgi:tetratricopeptide (TPR) repeat protein